MRISATFILWVLLLLTVTLSAQQTHSDNGDGTFTNPVIAADYPDPDVILVDNVYYMVSTTMFIFPGVTLLKSFDLVNWEYCSNAAQRFDIGACYNLDGCHRYGKGQWATSLKYKDGTFYLYHVALDEGGFLYTSKNPEGPWEMKRMTGYYDPGLFFDDNGKIYVAHGYSKLYMTELDPNFVAIDSNKLVFTGDIRPGLEGTHVYKINGYYYLYCTYGGRDGIQVALRSTNIYGPYEEKIVIRDTQGDNFGIHQGALIKTQSGEWWTMLFVDSGPFGRFPSLQPVTWTDGWPMVGVNGEGVVKYKKPNVGKSYPVKTLPTSDDFDSPNLGMQWGWNHNPVQEKWSLTENPGKLRLHTAKVVTNLREARNTLTQRIFAYYSNTVNSVGTIKMELGNMQDDDVAGLAVFQDPYAFIGIKQIKGIKYVLMVNNGKTIDSVAYNSSEIFLQAQANYGTGISTFAYSSDNKEFKQLGNSLSMQFNLSIFTGNKFCLFNYATKSLGGYVDFDWFHAQMSTASTSRN